VGVVRPIRLTAVTINPFYPSAADGGQFRADFLDADALKSAMIAAVGVPVVNVLVEGAARLLTRDDPSYLD